MKNNDFFYKRFSVGLTLDASISSFETFLLKYSKYISNFYFSLPLGDKFHARENVVRQMHDPSKVDLLWKMLKLIKSYGIKLEFVLNNGNITASDIVASNTLNITMSSLWKEYVIIRHQFMLKNILPF